MGKVSPGGGRGQGAGRSPAGGGKGKGKARVDKVVKAVKTLTGKTVDCKKARRPRRRRQFLRAELAARHPAAAGRGPQKCLCRADQQTASDMMGPMGRAAEQLEEQGRQGRQARAKLGRQGPCKFLGVSAR